MLNLSILCSFYLVLFLNCIFFNDFIFVSNWYFMNWKNFSSKSKILVFDEINFAFVNLTYIYIYVCVYSLSSNFNAYLIIIVKKNRKIPSNALYIMLLWKDITTKRTQTTHTDRRPHIGLELRDRFPQQ